MSTLQSRRWTAVSAAVVIFGCPCLGIAAILDVPADYPTIQACIDAAVSGVDECLVAPGTYHETINFLGKAVTLRSSGGADVTTIDATAIGGSVVTCANSEGPDTVLNGFTITGAAGTNEGGGMFNYYSSPTVTNCTISENTSHYGGGMYNYESSPTVSECTFSGNTAESGAGMYNSNSSSPTVSNCAFNGNIAISGRGGGMYDDEYSSPTVTDCTFSGNTAESGGGMYNSLNCSPTVANCAFNGNTATLYGGGMRNNSSNPTVINCTFSGNTADDGGGLHNITSSAAVTNCMFDGNMATKGGGMYNYSSNSTITNCVFSGNAADLYGGGIYNFFGRPIITNSNFDGNKAVNGGGMYNFSSGTTVTNCVFRGNTSSLGGGVMNDGTYLTGTTFTKSTFAGNKSSAGGAMYNYFPCDPQLTSCIFWGNSPDEIRITDFYAVPTLFFSDVQGGLPVGAVDGGGNIDLDPMFVRPPDPGPDGTWDGVDDDYGDLRLQAGSPCIDAGDPAFVPQSGETDLEGHARVLCERVDMGAYEFGIGDYDCNHTVNLSDFAAWPDCMTGPMLSHEATEPRSHEGIAQNRQLAIGNRQLAINCEAFDFNADGDVDLHDYYLFSQVFTAP